MPRASCEAEGLRALAPRLFSVLSTGSHALLPHWLSHYSALGVDLAKAHVVLDNHSAYSAERAASILRSNGVRVAWLRGESHRDPRASNRTAFRAVRLQLLNTYLRSLPHTTWVLPADVDEFYRFPCDALQQLVTRKREALCGKMLDRVASDLQLRAVTPTPAITQQFPLCVPYRAQRFSKARGSTKRAKTTKVTLLRARMLGGTPYFVDAHAARVEQPGGAKPQKLGGPTRNNCLDIGYFSHYSFTSEKSAVYQRSEHTHDTSSLYAPRLDGETRNLLREWSRRFVSTKTAAIRSALGCGNPT